MADGDVYKVTLEWRYSSIDVAVQNVLWFRQSGEEGNGSPETVLATRIASVMPAGSSWPSLLRAWLDQGFGINNIRVQRVYPTVALAEVLAVNVAGQGQGGPTYIPSPCAVLVRLRAVRGDRRGLGRLYIGGIASVKTAGGTEFSLANNGYWGANVRAAVYNFLDNLQAAAQDAPDGGAVYFWGVWSKTIAGPSPPYAYALSEMQSWEVTSPVRVQRRREVGVGI